MACRIGLDDLLRRMADEHFFVPPVTLHSRDGVNDTPLHLAAWWGDAEAIQVLLTAGADVNAVGEMGYTPLHVAVVKGDATAVRVLLAAGARSDIRHDFGKTAILSGSGNTAAEEAMRSGNPELIVLFAEYAAESGGVGS